MIAAAEGCGVENDEAAVLSFCDHQLLAFGGDDCGVHAADTGEPVLRFQVGVESDYAAGVEVCAVWTCAGYDVGRAIRAQDWAGACNGHALRHVGVGYGIVCGRHVDGPYAAWHIAARCWGGRVDGFAYEIQSGSGCGCGQELDGWCVVRAGGEHLAVQHAVAGEGIDWLQAEAAASGWSAEATLTGLEQGLRWRWRCPWSAASVEVDDSWRFDDHLYRRRAAGCFLDRELLLPEEDS